MLKISGLCKSYSTTLHTWNKHAKKSPVLDDVSFIMDETDSVGLVGKSGCGKSTLARLLVRLEPPDCGEILWMGKDISFFKKQQLKRFRKDCQFIQQDSLSSFNPLIQMKANLEEPLNNHFHLSKKDAHEKIIGMLRHFHLNEQLLTRYPHELSGGQRQRFNIIRALLVQPKLLICDEITAGLDKVTESCIISHLQQIQLRDKMAILFISHDLRLVQRICNTIHLIENGRLIESAHKVDDSFSFEHPHAHMLFRSLPVSHPSERGWRIS